MKEEEKIIWNGDNAQGEKTLNLGIFFDLDNNCFCRAVRGRDCLAWVDIWTEIRKSMIEEQNQLGTTMSFLCNPYLVLCVALDCYNEINFGRETKTMGVY